MSDSTFIRTTQAYSDGVAAGRHYEKNQIIDLLLEVLQRDNLTADQMQLVKEITDILEERGSK